MRVAIVLTMFAMGCPRNDAGPAATAEGSAPPAQATDRKAPPASDVVVPLRDVVCPDRCWALTVEGHLQALDPVTLTLADPIATGLAEWERLGANPRLVVRRPEGDGWVEAPVGDDGTLGEVAPLELETLEDDGEADRGGATQRLKHVFESGHRMGFHRSWPTPDNHVLVYHPTGLGGGPSLGRVGKRTRFVPAPEIPEGRRYPAWLAIRPDGTEVYLLTWPDGPLKAYHPISLEPLWTMTVDPGAHALYVDHSGSMLILVEGGEVEDGGWLDYSLTTTVQPGEDPVSDDALARRPRPDGARTVIVDLNGPRILVRIAGDYLRLISLDDGSHLLVTTEGVVRILGPGAS